MRQLIAKEYRITFEGIALSDSDTNSSNAEKQEAGKYFVKWSEKYRPP